MGGVLPGAFLRLPSRKHARPRYSEVSVAWKRRSHAFHRVRKNNPRLAPRLLRIPPLPHYIPPHPCQVKTCAAARGCVLYRPISNRPASELPSSRGMGRRQSTLRSRSALSPCSDGSTRGGNPNIETRERRDRTREAVSDGGPPVWTPLLSSVRAHSTRSSRCAPSNV